MEIIIYNINGKPEVYPKMFDCDIKIQSVVGLLKKQMGVTQVLVVPCPEDDKGNTTGLQRTVEWFNEATPSPTAKNISTQIGCNFEEMGELLNAISLHNDQKDIFVDGLLINPKNVKSNLVEAIQVFQNMCKEHQIAYIKEEDRLETLDAICDATVTGVGIAVYTGMNVVGGYNEVNRANFSKFDKNGKAIRDKNQKIIKGPDYKKDDLRPYV